MAPSFPSGCPAESRRQPPGTLLRRRLNPVLVAILVDVGACLLADAAWLAMSSRTRPFVALGVTLAVVGMTMLRGGYRTGRPARIGGALPGAAVALAPAVAAPVTPYSPPDLLLSLLWLGTACVVALAAGRGVLSALRAGRLGPAMAPRTVLLAGPADAAPIPLGESVIGHAGARLPGRGDHLGDLAALDALIRLCRVDRVLVLPGMAGHAPRLARCSVAVALAGPEGVVEVSPPPLDDWSALVKRAEDVVLAGVGLLVAGLPMLFAAAAIRLDSPGPVLFRQARVGRDGAVFRMLKFRTMRDECADPAGTRQTAPRDPRLTRVGGLLRRTSLDELPQLLNVLRGEMSLVGPRPHAVGMRIAGRALDAICPDYAARHRMRPGLTGLAQVRGHRGALRSEAALAARVRSDLEYVARWSLRRDLSVLGRTAGAVLLMRNAF